jgi:hypothetical protein
MLDILLLHIIILHTYYYEILTYYFDAYDTIKAPLGVNVINMIFAFFLTKNGVFLENLC